MKKFTNVTIVFIVLGFILIVSPIFFPIDWAHGKAMVHSYLALGFSISIIKHTKTKKLTKTNIVVIVVFYVILFALIVSSILSYPIGIIPFS